MKLGQVLKCTVKAVGISDLCCCWKWWDAVIFARFSRQPQINKAAAFPEVEWSLPRQEMLCVCGLVWFSSRYLFFTYIVGNCWEHRSIDQDVFRECPIHLRSWGEAFFALFPPASSTFLNFKCIPTTFGTTLMPVSFKVGFNSTLTRLISEHLERNGNGEDSFQTVIQKGLTLFDSAVSGLLCDVLHRDTFKLKIKPVYTYLSSSPPQSIWG